LKKAALAWLVEFLEISKKNLVKPSSFEERLRIQKAAFLLKHLEVKPFTSYDFNLYLRGPYSPSLAADYYKLGDMTLEDFVSPRFKPNRKAERLLKWFISHPSEWLEVASSIISIRERYPSVKNEEVYSLLRLSKPWVNRTLFRRILKELSVCGLPR